MTEEEDKRMVVVEEDDKDAFESQCNIKLGKHLHLTGIGCNNGKFWAVFVKYETDRIYQ